MFMTIPVFFTSPAWSTRDAMDRVSPQRACHGPYRCRRKTKKKGKAKPVVCLTIPPVSCVGCDVNEQGTDLAVGAGAAGDGHLPQ